MEKVHQSVNAEGLQIPIVLMRQYGLDAGSRVVLELEPEAIRVVPAQPDREAIENRALRYLLAHVGDAVSVEATWEAEKGNWAISVYGAGRAEPVGVLTYSAPGALVPEHSTSPAAIRSAALAAIGR